jgi:competence protein ComGC
VSTQAPSTGNNPKAFTVTELLVMVAFIALLAAIFLPALAKSRAYSSRLGCANYLKQIGLAFRTWGIDNGDRFPMQVSVTNGGTMDLLASGAVYPHFLVMSNELSTPKVLLCANDEKRRYATNFATDLSDRNLSYFVNVEAINGSGSSLLSGDRNITNKARPPIRLVSLSKADAIGWTREIHVEKGYLGFADGSVRSFDNGSWVGAIQIAEGITNRLAVP